jgi:hypothetical protein
MAARLYFDRTNYEIFWSYREKFLDSLGKVRIFKARQKWRAMPILGTDNGIGPSSSVGRAHPW